MVSAMSYAKSRALLLLAATLTTQGCTTPARNVGAVYTPPSQYQGYTCAQLVAEFQRNQQRSLDLGARLDKAANKDGLISTVGAVLFFPALLLLGGNAEEEAEFATLKGHAEAMRQSAFQKKCSNIDAQVAQPSTP